MCRVQNAWPIVIIYRTPHFDFELDTDFPSKFCIFIVKSPFITLLWDFGLNLIWSMQDQHYLNAHYSRCIFAAPGAMCISNLILEHIWLIKIFQDMVLDNMVQFEASPVAWTIWSRTSYSWTISRGQNLNKAFLSLGLTCISRKCFWK